MIQFQSDGGSPAPRTPASERPRVLIAEDDLGIAFAVREFLCDHGFAVDCVIGVAESSRMLHRFEYALLLTDLHLSAQRRAEGLLILSQAREHQPAMRSILLTAFPTPQIEYDARRLGAVDVLVKPVRLPDLLAVIRALQQPSCRMERLE
jgi:two-component system, OmpR family, response regulator